MSSFTEPLILSPTVTGWKTTRAFQYEIGLEGSGLKVTVPDGTWTDLGSVPRLLWPFLAPHEPRVAAAYVLHDYLCRWQGFHRAVADAVLYEAFLVLGAPRWKARMIFSGVTLWRALRVFNPF